MACGCWVRVVIYMLERATVDLSNIGCFGLLHLSQMVDIF